MRKCLGNRLDQYQQRVVSHVRDHSQRVVRETLHLYRTEPGSVWCGHRPDGVLDRCVLEDE